MPVFMMQGGDMVNSAGSGIYQLTSQSRLGIFFGGGLKETGARTTRTDVVFEH